jgi:hypothetical protein
MKEYIVDERGQKRAIVIPIEEYEELTKGMLAAKEMKEKLEVVKIISENLFASISGAAELIDKLAAANKTIVVLPIEEYGELLEDIHDLLIMAERRDEPTIAFEDLKERLKEDGLL